MIYCVKSLAIITGLLVAGEATALFIGTQILSKEKSPWVNQKNNIILALDVVSGLALIFLAWLDQKFPLSIQSSVFLLIALLSHVYRDWEYLQDAVDKFCANLPLFLFNNLKLLGRLYLVIVVFRQSTF
jgi:hypothetical protein